MSERRGRDLPDDHRRRHRCRGADPHRHPDLATPGYQTRVHSHPYVETLTVISGRGEAWLDGRSPSPHRARTRGHGGVAGKPPACLSRRRRRAAGDARHPYLRQAHRQLQGRPATELTLILDSCRPASRLKRALPRARRATLRAGNPIRKGREDRWPISDGSTLPSAGAAHEPRRRARRPRLSVRPDRRRHQPGHEGTDAADPGAHRPLSARGRDQQIEPA